MIVGRLHNRKRYILLVIEALEIIGPVNRKKVTGPVTILGEDAPPRIGNTERLGAI